MIVCVLFVLIVFMKFKVFTIHVSSLKWGACAIEWIA